MVTPKVIEWLERNREMEDWFLHVHYWDPHTPYRTPEEGERADFRMSLCRTTGLRIRNFVSICGTSALTGANEINMWNDETFSRWPKHPGSLKTKDEAKHFIDLYDDSVKFTDDNIGLITSWLKEHGLYGEDLAIIITADHGEDLGEFGVYGRTRHGRRAGMPYPPDYQMAWSRGRTPCFGAV